MDYVQIIISLLSGAAGGNLAGKLMKNFSLGTLGNSIVGILGGGLGSTILSNLTGMETGDSAMTISGVIGSILSGGVGGGVLMAIIGVIKNLFNKG